MSDVKASIVEAHRVEGLAGLVYYRGSELSKDEAKQILDFAVSVRGALEAARSAPLVVESREAVRQRLTNALIRGVPGLGDQPHVASDLAVELTEDLLASGTVRLAADVVREAKAEAWDEGAVYALERLSNGFDSVLMSHNPYSTEEESR